MAVNAGGPRTCRNDNKYEERKYLGGFGILGALYGQPLFMLLERTQNRLVRARQGIFEVVDIAAMAVKMASLMTVLVLDHDFSSMG